MTLMMLALARSTRRARNTDADLARAAAEREMQLQAELNADNVVPMAANFSRRDEDPTESGANGQG